MPKRSTTSKPKALSPILGRGAFAAISAVEGLKLTPAGQRRISIAQTQDDRRAEVLKAYRDAKKRK
jgi:hypothetical protein